jgi:phosphohistidine phosphatase
VSELYLVRHAKAIPQDGETRDRDRALENSGRKAASNLARWIATHGVLPDLVLCSPSLRTRQTLEILAEGFASKPHISFEDELYLAEFEGLLVRIRSISADVEHLMIVGHNPGLHDLAQNLWDGTNGPLAARLKDSLPTASFAKFEIAGPWRGLARRHAHLAELFKPKDQKE